MRTCFIRKETRGLGDPTIYVVLKEMFLFSCCLVVVVVVAAAVIVVQNTNLHNDNFHLDQILQD